MGDPEDPSLEAESEQFVRLPGLHRSWEIQQLLEPGCVLHVEEAGQAEDGTPLFAVYRQELDGIVAR
jgi:hypothetical protein